MHASTGSWLISAHAYLHIICLGVGDCLFLCQITLLSVALHQINIQYLGSRHVSVRQTSCICDTANTHTEKHPNPHPCTSLPLNWPKCVACDGGKGIQTWSGECVVAMGMFSGRQSARRCSYEEGWRITRTKFVCQLHRGDGGEEIIKSHKGSPMHWLLVANRVSAERGHGARWPSPAINLLSPNKN